MTYNAFQGRIAEPPCHSLSVPCPWLLEPSCHGMLRGPGALSVASASECCLNEVSSDSSATPRWPTHGKLPLPVIFLSSSPECQGPSLEMGVHPKGCPWRAPTCSLSVFSLTLFASFCLPPLQATWAGDRTVILTFRKSGCLTVLNWSILQKKCLGACSAAAAVASLPTSLKAGGKEFQISD